MASAAELTAYRERLWSAISANNAGSLESGMWEVVLAEANAGRASGFRLVLLHALDGSSVAQSDRRMDLVQLFAHYAKVGSVDAAVLLGAVLCFHATGDSEVRSSASWLPLSSCSRAGRGAAFCAVATARRPLRGCERSPTAWSNV